MAEYIMKELVKREGVASDWEIESAAVSREEIGNPVYPPARRKLSEHGIDCSSKRARQLLNSDYEKYDLLIGMDHANLRSIAVCNNHLIIFADKIRNCFCSTRGCLLLFRQCTSKSFMSQCDYNSFLFHTSS